MTAAPQSDQEIVVGTVVGTIQKAADKWQVEVQSDGSQYTRKLWTKDPNVIGQMTAMIGQRLSFMCGVSNWTMNDGTPVRSLWLNGFGQPGEVAATPVVSQPQAVPVVAPSLGPPVVQPAPVVHDVRTEQIHRQTATKVAVSLLSYLQGDQQTFANLISISERLVSYYEHGAPGEGNPEGSVGPVPQGHPDDNIPF